MSGWLWQSCSSALHVVHRTDRLLLVPLGSTVARFAGDTVHSRLAANDAFKNRDFEAALKRAFLETDEDLRASALVILVVLGGSWSMKEEGS